MELASPLISRRSPLESEKEINKEAQKIVDSAKCLCQKNLPKYPRHCKNHGFKYSNLSRLKKIGPNVTKIHCKINAKNKITHEIRFIDELKNLVKLFPNLKTLMIPGCKVNRYYVSSNPLVGLSDLHYLSFNMLRSRVGFFGNSFAQLADRITTLILSGLNQDNSKRIHLLSKFSQLKFLTLNGSKQVDFRKVKLIFPKSLKRLTISEGPVLLTDESFSEVRTLKKLDLTACEEGLSDHSLIYISENKSLETLLINGTKNEFTNDGVFYLSDLKLRYFGITSLNFVSENALLDLLNKLSLESLRICDYGEKAFINAALKIQKNLTVFETDQDINLPSEDKGNGTLAPLEKLKIFRIFKRRSLYNMFIQALWETDRKSFLPNLDQVDFIHSHDKKKDDSFKNLKKKRKSITKKNEAIESSS
ncbi:MAG: hypothetical protein K940chlam3_00741 [Chlamydiae bacterium]|nr:hypothetical protein [Chlamydiota bacterium]